jgi:hypothetical protein
VDAQATPILEIGIILLGSIALAAGTIDGVLFTAIIAAVALSIAASSIAVRLVPVPATTVVPLEAA